MATTISDIEHVANLDDLGKRERAEVCLRFIERGQWEAARQHAISLALADDEFGALHDAIEDAVEGAYCYVCYKRCEGGDCGAEHEHRGASLDDEYSSHLCDSCGEYICADCCGEGGLCEACQDEEGS